jgi:hypothetical protein
MTNSTFVVLMGISTLFIAISVGCLGYAAWYWRCVWREKGTRHTQLALVFFYKNFGFFIGYATALIVRLYALSNDLITAETVTPGGLWRSIITWGVLTVPCILAYGIARRWFAIEEDEGDAPVVEK